MIKDTYTRFNWLRVLPYMLLLAVLIQAVTCMECFGAWEVSLRNIGYNFALVVPIWWGNGYIAEVLDKHICWVQHPGKRLVASVLAMLLYSTAAFLLINYLYFVVLLGQPASIMASTRMLYTVLSQVGITALITFFMYSRSFLSSWRELAVNAEKLKREQLTAEHELLKAQVNPHFLFNSLNALTSLVESDQKQAVRFIRKLSEVYRYVLDSRQKEVVPLAEELAFLESYIYLQKIRHGEALQVQNDLPPDKGLMVAPLALQLLVENAIKHNMALEEEPLRVHLYLEDGYLVVNNNLQQRRIREEESTGTGLANIQARYSYLTDKAVQVQHSDKNFTVKLPLLYFKG